VIENMVARDGLEPPPPACSGLASAIRIYLNPFGFITFQPSKPPDYWNHNGTRIGTTLQFTLRDSQVHPTLPIPYLQAAKPVIKGCRFHRANICVLRRRII
jgi:hypothetical protein